jgi:hypothetical protein
MATSQVTSLPMWLAGCTYDGDSGNDLRNSHITTTFYDKGAAGGSGTVSVLGGVVGGGSALKVSAAAALNITVAPGSFVVPVSSAPASGGYASTLSSSATLQVAAANPVNPRIDIVVAYVNDTGTSASQGFVEVITGTPAPSPAAPAAPANSTVLAQIAVAANASSVTSGMITDKRAFTVAAGGVLTAVQGAVQGYNGQLAYDPVAGTFYHNSASGPQPFAGSAAAGRSLAFLESSVSFSSETMILSVTVTTTGEDISIYFKWPGVDSTGGSSNTFTALFRMYIDSDQVDCMYTPAVPANVTSQGGGSWTYSTSGAAGDTPSAGSHTITVTAQDPQGYNTSVIGASGLKILLIVGPATG